MKKVFLFLFLLNVLQLTAQVVDPLTVYKQLTQRGDITFAANTILTCSGGGCSAAQSNTPPGSGQPASGGATAANNAWNNNAYTMVYVDADGTPAFAGKTTFSSSRSFLDLSNRPGCSIIEAYLTWGGNILTTTTNYNKRDSVYVKLPTQANYKGFQADFLVDNNAGSTVAGTQVTYQCYKRITDDVRAAGEGDYWVGNVVANTGAINMCAGWAIIVIYGDENLPLRNLTLYKGYSNISLPANGGIGPVSLGISGFFTPPNPASAVNVKLGVFSFEGDQGIIGDSLKFNNLLVANTKNNQNNFFNSSITQADTNTARFPSYLNNLGFDADIVSLPNSTKNYLTNGAGSATIKLTTSSDQYWPFMVTTAIDVFEPNIYAFKNWVDNNGGQIQLGDTITYTIKVNNKGTDPALIVELIDSIIGAMYYVPNSCVITSGPNAGAKTDASGDDQVDVNGNVIKFRLGDGASFLTGGELGITAATDSVTTISFKVKVTDDCKLFQCSQVVKNLAYVNFVGFSSGQSRSTLSSATGLDAFGCPIQGPTEFTVIVPPCTLVADTIVDIYCEPYDLSNILPYRPGYSSYYNSSWVSVTNATDNGTYYAIKQLYPGCTDTIAIIFSSTGNCTTLPVGLKNIYAYYNNNNGLINWTISNETNIEKYIIEKSLDGVVFDKIGELNAHNYATLEQNYSYTDYNIINQKRVYYRIKIIEMNGAEKNSKIVFINTVASNTVLEIMQIVPNPIINNALVKILSYKNQQCNYQLINNLGQIIIANKVHFNEGYNEIKIDAANLKKGIYAIKIQGTDNTSNAIKTILIN